jgi:anti-anti-sigma factor
MASDQADSLLGCSVESGVRVFVVKPAQLNESVAEPLRREFARIFDQPGPANAVINLERVSILTSPGVTVLITVLKRVRSGGGQVVLCGVGSQVAEVLRLCQLIRQNDQSSPAVFPTDPDTPTAIRRLTGSA